MVVWGWGPRFAVCACWHMELAASQLACQKPSPAPPLLAGLRLRPRGFGGRSFLAAPPGTWREHRVQLMRGVAAGSEKE
jgi:hypothetical protein